MTDTTLIGKPEMIAAIVALAVVVGYMLRRLFDGSMSEKKTILSAYLEHVTSATEAMTKTADSMSLMAEAVNANTSTLQAHCEHTQREHAAVLTVLGLSPADVAKKRAGDVEAAKIGGRRKSDHQLT
jgi:hypothetical protein